MLVKNIPRNLKKTKQIKSNLSLTKKPGTIIFASYPEKKVDKRYIDSFWERYFNGKLKEAISKRKDRSIISDINLDMKIFPLSPSVALTIRKMEISRGKEYIRLKKNIEKIIKQNKLKYSEIVLADIIDYKIKDGNYYIMERIIPSFTVNDLFNYKKYNDFLFENRFKSNFFKTINKTPSKIIKKMYQDLDKAMIEISNSPIIWNKDKKSKFDFHIRNTVVIDYNPNTGKFKFGLIDLKGTFSSSF